MLLLEKRAAGGCRRAAQLDVRAAQAATGPSQPKPSSQLGDVTAFVENFLLLLLRGDEGWARCRPCDESDRAHGQSAARPVAAGYGEVTAVVALDEGEPATEFQETSARSSSKSGCRLVQYSLHSVNLLGQRYNCS